MSKVDSSLITGYVDVIVNPMKTTAERTTLPLFNKVMEASRNKTGAAGNYFAVGANCYLEGQNVHHRNKVQGAGFVPSLPSSLLGLFREWETPYKQIQEDTDRIRQSLRSILLRADSWQEIRNMVPDHVQRPAIHITACERTTLDLYAGIPDNTQPPTEARLQREAIWDPRLLDMYEKVGGLIDIYMGYALL